MQKFVMVWVAVVLFVAATTTATKLEERFAWGEMEYEWPSDDMKNEQIQTGRYIPENNLPLGLEVWQNKLFVTVPRWKAGVASSLNYIDLDSKEKSPKLRPYPDWKTNRLPIEIHRSEDPLSHRTAAGRTEAEKPVNTGGPGLTDNSTIISTFRVSIDNCDRLWVMDTGLNDILGKPNLIAPSAIIIFDLKTDKLIRRFSIPEDQTKDETFFANIIIDNGERCENTFAYIPDLGGYGVVVYSFKTNKSWRIKHNYFHFDPLQGNFDIDKINFQWTDGVFGMAVGKRIPGIGHKNIYFHALASNKEFFVSNKVLQNEDYVTTPAAYFDFKLLGDRGDQGQSSAEVFDPETGVVFYTQLNRDSIGCWNTKNHDKGVYNPDSLGLVDGDSVALVFPNDLKVDANHNLWVLSDRMPSFIYKQLNRTDINYRILVGKTTDIIKGTPCDI